MSHDETKAIEDLTRRITELSDKFDAHLIKHDEDMRELKPYVQALGGFGILYKIFLGAGAFAVAYVAIKSGLQKL